MFFGAEATTWSSTPLPSGASLILPYEIYEWKAERDFSGKPLSDFTAFNFAIPSSNAINNRVFTKRISKYNSYGEVIEDAVPSPAVAGALTYSSKIFRNDIGFEMAFVSNAKFEESGAFTCDYDLSADDAGYFDKRNGWVKEDAVKCVLDNSITHFGLKALCISNPSLGISRNFRMERGKTYIMSAWIKTGNFNINSANAFSLVIGGNYHKEGSPAGNWPIICDITSSLPCSGTVTVTGSSGQWQLVELTIPPVNDIDWTNGYTIARFWIGNQSSATGAIVWVDDIRFYPKNAFVRTTYYHPLWNMPVISVDANNNPGQKTVYDGYRRPTRWYKVRSNQPDVLVKSQDYYFRGF